jgi:hypothetical protein
LLGLTRLPNVATVSRHLSSEQAKVEYTISVPFERFANLKTLSSNANGGNASMINAITLKGNGSPMRGRH